MTAIESAAPPGLPFPETLGRALLAALAALALVMAFHQVVHQSVQQGELRRRAVALLADATWHCNALRGRSLREACLMQLDAVPRDANLQTLVVTATSTAP